MKPVWLMIKEGNNSQLNFQEEIYLGGEKEKKKKKNWYQGILSHEDSSFAKKEFKQMSSEEQ